MTVLRIDGNFLEALVSLVESAADPLAFSPTDLPTNEWAASSPSVVQALAESSSRRQNEVKTASASVNSLALAARGATTKMTATDTHLSTSLSVSAFSTSSSSTTPLRVGTEPR